MTYIDLYWFWSEVSFQYLSLVVVVLSIPAFMFIFSGHDGCLTCFDIAKYASVSLLVSLITAIFPLVSILYAIVFAVFDFIIKGVAKKITGNATYRCRCDNHHRN